MAKTKVKKSKFPKTLTIKRSQWCRGGKEKYGPSMLCNDRGFRCCLGFLGRACGLKDGQMVDIAAPISEELGEGRNLFPKPKEDWGVFMEVNDDPNMSSHQREKKLTELFKDELGIKVKFKP